ncbi:hypothetical protein B6K86_06590 [Lachnospiraceae bacterium]|nr:hypothetical protein B6K86_06590 [Lachnospiraceae bacterium]
MQREFYAGRGRESKRSRAASQRGAAKPSGICGTGNSKSEIQNAKSELQNLKSGIQNLKSEPQNPKSGIRTEKFKL